MENVNLSESRCVERIRGTDCFSRPIESDISIFLDCLFLLSTVRAFTVTRRVNSTASVLARLYDFHGASFKFHRRVR